ncbi:MAG TPA: PIN domain-containing protein [Candidatus Thermoplasmatota archaeon]|nr:PIN domain-containing protein [Candidatus Thermoplasmatota archaeon]
MPASPRRSAEGAEAKIPSAVSARSASAPAKAKPVEPTPVVFDTNALILPFAHGTRVEEDLAHLFGSVRLLVPSTVLVELGTLAYKGKGAVARHAKMALKFAERCEVLQTKLPGDDGLLEVARKAKAVVVTNDRTLQAECQKSGLTVVVSREHGRRLALMGAASGQF